MPNNPTNIILHPQAQKTLENVCKERGRWGTKKALVFCVF